MFAYLWPIGLVILSNIMYQVCTKEVPSEINAFASLTVTYIVAAAASLVFFFVLGGNSGSNGLFGEYSKINWAPFVLGVVIVGLEVGWIFAYKAGWEISTGFIVQSSVLAIFLLILGVWLYHEALTWNKVVGIVICLIGLVFINLKQ
ncbi:MAG: EamA family transporter [Mogibacterium sp.]|nr:EamA family transporter [Mogibacterium sp.]